MDDKLATVQNLRQTHFDLAFKSDLDAHIEKP